ncbi:hypothetical protein PYCCODRAFT_1377379 [Trametes coccinea BRFM310]|uniref:TM7S3/TM198-like domain-containing protein n=1 Tax=Trametes coccinea (strain BRFM310) TaxID=1353009 RepID=A0A1Y2I831_TRAC3|nr:hypothetical protein PYCCODRAFT_1377379 [Trametes coccinea BRFM310]
MAASFRQNNSSLLSGLLTVLSCLLVFLALASSVSCLPTAPAAPSVAFPETQYWKRIEPVVVTSDDGGNTTVIDPSTNQEIQQGSATDGGGIDFSVPAIIWLAFVFAVGVPLALAGIRLWRATTGAGIGLALTALVWVAFVNSISAEGLSDIVITVISLGAFAIGFLIGVFNIGRMAGILTLGVLGGFSIGIRIILLRPGLLIPKYVANWFVLAVFMIIGLGAMLYRRRFGLLSSCAAVGSFLVALGIDLILNKQSGMAAGLRFLFDRNSAHFLAIVHAGYHPPVITQVLLGASIGAIPILAFAQHKIFSSPFRPVSTVSDADTDSASLVEEAAALNKEKTVEKEGGSRTDTPGSESLLSSRFSSS